jgi:hypothetical protein
MFNSTIVSNMNSSQPLVLVRPSNVYFQDVGAPGNFLMILAFARIVNVTAICTMCCFFGIVLRALRRPASQRSAVKRDTLRLLLANILATMVATSWALGMSLLQDADAEFCDNYGRIGGRYVDECFAMYPSLCTSIYIYLAYELVYSEYI